MALADIALRASGFRARPPAPRSTTPPLGALESPTFYGTPGQPLWPSFDPQTAIRIGERNVFAMRCVEVIANSISGLEYQAGNVKSRIVRPTSRTMQLLGPAPGRPNPKWSSAKIWRFWIIQYLITGKYAALRERDDAGRTVALWPLMAQHLNPVLAQPRSQDYFEGFRYGTRGTNGYREFKPEDVVYCWRPSQEDFRQPEPPMRLAQWGIQVLRLLDEFDRGFLQNGGVPAHLVITPAFDENKSRTAFRDQFRRKFGGAANAGKVAFSEYTDESGDFGQGQPRQTVDVKLIGQSQKDSEMRQSRMDRIDEMCAALGVPLSLLGISRDSKYTNMQSDKEVLWQITNAPIITELEDNSNTALSDLDGPLDVGWFDTSGVPELRKPPVFDPAEGVAAVAAGLISDDEWRADRGLPPKPNGEGAKFVTAPKPAPVVALPAADPQGDGQPPVIDTVPPKPKLVKAAAVRTDLLEVVREQLAVELTAQRLELEARRDGKRGGRRRAHAQLDLSLAYDTEHWQRRLVTNLGPGLRAAGYDDGAIEGFSIDVTAAVLEQLDQSTDVGATDWGPDEYLAALTPRQPHVQLVDHSTAEKALLQLAGGQGDAAAALSMLGGGG
jgi:HK97 family phage portal protein